jgi:alkylation response protein AidB-like acyl-CoA dehydrogenase
MIGFELTEEQNDLRRLAREFAEREMIPRAREYDEKETFPSDVCEAAFKAGLMNLGVPREQVRTRTLLGKPLKNKELS